MSNSNDLNIQIHANTKEALANIKKLEAEIKGFATTTKTSSNSIEGFTSSLKTMAGVYVGFEALKGSISKVLDVGMEFEKSIDKLGAISNASANELEAMKQKAEELGATTQYSASQVAEAMNYQAMAGMKSNEILTATKDILDLATVGSMDLARASDIATDSMSGFGLEADDLGRVVDIMAVTTTNANTDVEQLGEAFKNVAPVAKNLNVSMEETSSMLGVLANAGRKGGEAGTHLKIIMQRLASSNKSVVNGLKELGIEAYDSNGKLKPMTATLKEIEGKLKDLNEQDRNKILKDLFGEEAISSANIILDNLGSMDELLKKVGNSAGEASKMAKDMNDNLDGDAKALNSALEGLANTIYERFLPALRDMTQSLTEIIRYVDENSEDFIKWGKTIVEVVASVYLLRKALLGLALAETALGVTSVATAFVGLASKARVAVASLMAFATANPVLLALGVVIAGVTYKLNEMEAEINKLNDATDRFNTSSSSTEAIYDKLNSTYSKTTDSYRLTREEYDKLGEAIGLQLSKLDDEIEKTKKASDGSRSYQEQIFQLARQKATLIESYEVLSDKLEIVTDATDDATKSTKAQGEVDKKAQNEFIKSIDKRIAKEKEKSLSLNESYAKEIEHLRTLKLSNEEYLKNKEKLEILYNRKLEEANKKYIKDTLSTYKTREKQHKSTIQTLLKKEKKLNQDILDEKKRLNDALKNLENERVLAIESLENKIHNLTLADASDYKKYIDSKKQADALYYKAKEALQKGDLTLAKKYMSDYQSLTTQIANTEIKENDRVIVSKRASAKVGMENLKKLKSLTNDYYAQEKQKALDVHNQKLAQIRTQLIATKAQLELEVQRLNLEKQMIELLTGKKVDIDTTSALNSIKALDGQIKGLDKEIKSKKDLKIDNSQSLSAIKKVKQSYGELTLADKTITIKSDTTPADFGINKLVTKTEGRHVTMTVNPDYKRAEDIIKQAIDNFESKDVVTNVTADTDEADAKVSELSVDIKKEKIAPVTANTQKAIDKVNALRKKIETPTVAIHTVNIDASKALSVIAKLKKATFSTHTVKINASKALSVISQLKKNTSSTHTIYTKEVTRRATGGMIPLKLATGGEANFERKSGRIAGYDPTDSDDVPALLTRGEFVIKRDAVKHYGDDFLYNLNSMNLPKYAVGGVVGSNVPTLASESSKNTVNLNLNIGDNSYSLMSDADVAEALERHIRGIS